MAKKYVSIEKLGLYDTKIKGVISAGDEAALAAAKTYADGLAVNYDAAGAAATVQGKLDTEVARAKAAEEANAAAAAKAQGDVDGLKTYVGTIPTTATATDIVGYVQEKTAGIATDTALEELTGRVAQAETDIDNIEKDYLKAADKTELADLITAEKNRAEGIEGGMETRLKAVEDNYLDGADKTELQGNIDGVAGRVSTIEGDYLKGADKTELQGKIDLKAAQTALDAEVERATGAEAGLQAQIDLIMNNPDTKDVIDSIAEFTQYIADHGTIADGFRQDIDKNKGDIAAEVKRAGEAESALSGRLDTLEAIDHDAYVGADAALKSELNGEIAKKADQTALTAAVQTLENADSGLDTRLKAVEAKFGDGEGNVEAQIAAAKQEAIATAAGDATSKANAAESAAKGHADSLNTAMNTRVEALEAIDHDHSNKAELDLIASGDKAKWDSAAAKAHEHDNKTVLDGITAENISTWNTVTSMATASALAEEVARAKAAEEANAAAIALFVECGEEDINKLFA